MSSPSNPLSLDSARELLRCKELRCTSCRIAVLQHLTEARYPLSHAEVADKLVPRGFDKSTIYRCLMELSDCGLLLRLDLGDHVWRFERQHESETHDDVHTPLLCTSCGQLTYLDDVDIATEGWRRNLVDASRETLGVMAIVAAVAILAVFAGGLALNISEQRRADRRIRQLADRVVLSQEEERARVSRELHDHVCQLLVSVKYRFEMATREVAAGAPGADVQLRSAVKHLADAIGTVRRISHELRPAALDELGLDAALTRLADELRLRGGPDVTLDLQPGLPPLPQAQAVALYRIAQEALANAERHAQARTVRLTLQGDVAQTRLEITDDGRGFNVDAIDAGGGIGLSNMRQRAESLGGALQVQASPAGTTVRALLPRSPDPERMAEAA